MKNKLLFLLVFVIIFTSCEKQNPTINVDEKIFVNTKVPAAKPLRYTICHYDTLSGLSTKIVIDQSEWPEHQSHGDLLGACSEVLTTICEQDWMIKNLDVSTYSDGTPIPEVQDYNEWATLTTGAWCYYENNSENGTVYGKLYNWYAVNDPRGLAPAGWHIPSNEEWAVLINCLGGDAVAGYAMTERGRKHWIGGIDGATNSSGFTALPSGIRYTLGAFDWLGERAFWWSSNPADAPNNWAWECNLVGQVYRDIDDKLFGFAVRCVRN